MCTFFHNCLALLSFSLVNGIVLKNIRNDYCKLYVNASNIRDNSCHKNGSFITTNEYELTLFDSSDLVLTWTQDSFIAWNIIGITNKTINLSSLKVLGIRSSEDQRLRPASFYLKMLNVKNVKKFEINGEHLVIYEKRSHYKMGPQNLKIEFKGSVHLGQIYDYVANSTKRIRALHIKGLHLPSADLCSHVQFFNLPVLQENVEILHLDVNMKINMKCFENYRKLTYIFIEEHFYERFENLTAFICNNFWKCEFTMGRNGLRCPPNCECSYEWGFYIHCTNRISKQIPPLPIPFDYKIQLIYSEQQLTQLPNNTLPGYDEVFKLIVSINNISSLAVYQLPRELQTLDISSNPITTIDYDVANYLNNNRTVYKMSIQWMPNCDERTLVKLLQESSTDSVFFKQLNGECPYKCMCCFDGNTDNFVIDCSGQTVDLLRLPYRTPNKMTLLFVNCSFRALPKELLRFVKTNRITLLDLRKNHLKYLDEETVDFLNSKHDNTTIELSENPWDCICKPRSFLFFLKNQRPAEYALTLARCKITMCPDSCVCCLDNLNNLTLTVNCRGQLLTQIPLLPDSVTNLNLENNYITEINLQSQEFLKKTILSTGLNLSLSGNPWTCICDENNLVAFAKSILLHIRDFSKMECSNLGKPLASVEDSEICPSYFIYLVILCVFSMIIITALNAFVYFKQPILMWFYEHEIFMSMAVRLDLERMKKFDAFLCFTHKDEHLIEDYVERLEKGQWKFRLCFYQRDWQVGASIPECIIQSEKDSRRIIILMTKNFLESTWGKLEFRLALHATSKDRCKRLIVIVYPDVENFDDLDSELKAYMVLNTYLKRDSPNFWNKLIYSMPHINQTNII